MNIKIIFENSDFLIVHKPSSVSFEGEGGVLALLRESFPQALGVHRLDKETTGLMIFALNKGAQRDLSFMFSNREVEKTYIAISTKKPLKKMGTIKGDLEKGRGGSYYLRRSVNNPSITKFESFYTEKSKLRLFILRPITGHTHQLRVHLKSIGSDILGDKRYGSDVSDRMYLACSKLSFKWRGELQNFEYYPETGEVFLRSDIQLLFREKMTKKKEC